MISESKLIDLYNKGIPIRELARKFKIYRPKIRKILNNNNIKIRDSRTAMISMGYIKEKKKFNLSSKEKAYLYGLVIGDVTPVKKSKYTLKLITQTTHIELAELLCKLFKKYGPTSYKPNRNNEFRFQAFVDLDSFSFLLEAEKEKIPYWINKTNLFDFLAGFIDSDGSIMIRKTDVYFQFIIRFFGENLSLLKEIKRRLEEKGYNLSMHKNHSKGDFSYHNGKMIKYNKDYHALEIQRRQQVLDLLNKLPIKHREKQSKKKLIFSIAKRKLKYWKDVKKEVKELKALIEKSVKLKKNLEDLS